jgi:hypothetical protein
MTETRKPGWAFYPGWILVSGLAVPLAWGLALGPVILITRVVGDTVELAEQTHITADAVFPYVLLPMIGLLTGLGQSILLGRILPRMAGWIAATIAGYVLPLILGPLVPGGVAGVLDGGWLAGAVGFAGIGALIGVCQWLVLRRRVDGAGWWIPFVAAGWAITGMVTGATVSSLPAVLVVALVPPVVGSAGMWMLLDRPLHRAQLSAYP